MGRDLHDLRKSQELIDDVPVMGLRDLIDCKTNMGRKKDIADIKLLRNYYHLELASKQKTYRAKKLSTAAATS
jgi:hypothetical protein